MNMSCFSPNNSALLADEQGDSRIPSSPTKNNLAEATSAFENLPTELLIKIFEYLQPYFLSRTITRVCKRFARILIDDLLWKLLITHSLSRYSNRPVKVDLPFDLGLIVKKWTCSRDVTWRDLAVQFNILELKWKTNKPKIKLNKFEQGHHASVDAVKIVGDGDTIVSCGRDRKICMWKIDNETLEVEKHLSLDRCHDGWLWDIDSCTPDTFYTCGWDNYVTHWAIREGLEKLDAYNCNRPVMAVTATRGLIAAGLNVPRITLIDPRIGLLKMISSPSITTFNVHRQSITDVLLVPEKNLLLSTSEDKTLCFFDLRRHNTGYKTVTVTPDNSFPRCLGYYREVIYIGDSRGNIHMYSLDCDIPEISVINVGTNTRLVSSLVPQIGGITVGTTDGHVRILHPSSPPVLIWDQKMAGEVTCVDHFKSLIAVSTTSNSVTVFRPSNIE